MALIDYSFDVEFDYSFGVEFDYSFEHLLTDLDLAYVYKLPITCPVGC